MEHNENKLADIDTLLENLRKEEGTTNLKHMKANLTKFSNHGRKRYKNC